MNIEKYPQYIKWRQDQIDFYREKMFLMLDDRQFMDDVIKEINELKNRIYILEKRNG